MIWPHQCEQPDLSGNLGSEVADSEQLAVMSALPRQLFVSALFDDPAFLEHHDLVGIFHGRTRRGVIE